MDKGFFVPRKMEEKLIDILTEATKEKKLNLGLFLDKYVLWWYDDRENERKCNLDVQLSLLKKVIDKPNDVRNLLTNSNVRGRKFREKMIKDIRLSISSNFIPILLKDKADNFYKKKIDYLLNVLSQQGFYIEYLPDRQSGLTLNWRLAINLGAASVYETSLLFHRNYSVPYIPGSAVKGVTKHWAILRFFEEAKCENWEEISCVEKILENASEEDVKLPLEKFQEKYTFKEDKKKIKPSEKLYYFFKQNHKKIKEIQEIFGTQGKKGEVIFFDALPIIEQKNDFIVLDVMNVHYKPYYEKGEIPGDWHNPTPIFFLAVEKGTKFRFALASKSENLVKKAKELLKEAVKKIGIGAKTSAGYGYFK